MSEDTPRMAERTDRQAQIDPWKDVAWFIEQQPRIQIADDGRTLSRDRALADLSAARAADALRHQQEIETLEVLLGQASQTAMLNRRAYLEEQDKATALRAALSTAEATIATDAALLRERDAQIAKLEEVVTAQAEEIQTKKGRIARQVDERTAADAQIASLTAQVEQRERQKHDANCELRGPGGAVDRRCSCGFRALRAELTTLRAERDARKED